MISWGLGFVYEPPALYAQLIICDSSCKKKPARWVCLLVYSNPESKDRVRRCPRCGRRAALVNRIKGVYLRDHVPRNTRDDSVVDCRAADSKVIGKHQGLVVLLCQESDPVHASGGCSLACSRVSRLEWSDCKYFNVNTPNAGFPIGFEADGCSRRVLKEVVVYESPL